MVKRSRHIVVKALVACALPGLLLACGSKRELRPAAKAELPVTPYGAPEQPTADDLLEPSTQARPGRNVELRRRSEVREEDPFDLPPE